MNIKLLLLIFYYFIYPIKSDYTSWYQSLEENSFENEDYDPEAYKITHYSNEERKGPLKIHVCDKSLDKTICECIRGGNQTLKCGAQDLKNANLIVPKEVGPIAIAHLERNSITYLFKNKILPGQEKSLLLLDLSDNKITDIEPGAFDNFVNLLELKLTKNNLDELSDDIFTKYLSSLHQLYLDDNFLNKLDVGVFDNLKNLKKLILDGNRNLKINKNVLSSSLSNLEVLSLDSCHLEKLDDDLFENLPNLRALSLSGNPLRTLPKAISPEKLPKLEILVLSDTYLEVLNKEELGLAVPNLKKLYMRRNRYLKRIDNCAFCGLKQLETIDFSDSKSLNEIDLNAFGKSPPKKLKQINLNNCNFSSLHEKHLKMFIGVQCKD
ncbi:hypothetical protein Mgra_00007454 [Meloidogyne graminicola]|uniref:LRRNT domain-containing protein n=1 Tax=Meloidogyne graminicola TaxID=189291 RepID=A0A8S9ZIL2_9BILA|nr:hypothetical protein Mgra_00007454 [Meloidogyne graminicola]